MFEVITSRKIDQPSVEIWQKLNDFGGVHQYHPHVKDSKTINSTSSSGKGAERMCTFNDGSSIKERIINYSDNKYEVEIYDPGKFPLKTAIAELKVDENNSTSSTVSFKMRFEPKFGPIGWIMGNMMMKSQFKEMLDSVLLGLDKHLTTGEIINIKSIKIN